MRNTLVLCCVAALSAISGTASAQDWTKSKWGPNDEIGAANYMTPELVVKAASLVKTGKTYALGIPVTSSTPAYPPRTFKITVVQPGQAGSPGLGPNKATYNDDILDTWVGIGSQLDGLGHLGIEHVYYNGNKLADFADPNGLKKLGIEKVPPMVTRGVLLDMAAYFKTDVVKEGTAFNVKEIEEAGVEGAKYLTGKGVVAIGADTCALEVLPFESKNVFEVHQILLAMNGTYILENMDTAALARDKGYEFLFVLGQPRWTGGVQAMINPIAIR